MKRGEKIPKRSDIDNRPAKVAKRKRYGDWEADLIQGAPRIGSVRQYFPKGSNFGDISEERLRKVAAEISDRPRNALGYEDPNDHLDQVKAA